uniref:hypothetical protein n=1 Tax=Paenibacillus durus TaxID=44251 RepID=UPI001E2A1689|nr:hypothetical protein [Paenibacillus durus]
MEPVIGLDVSKGSSVVQVFVKRNEAWGKPEVIRHGAQGFGRLKACAEQLQERPGKAPVIILEDGTLPPGA